MTAIFAREFRYASDRGRYAVIERDPADLEPIGSTWHDYVNDNIYKDLTIDPQTGVATATASYSFGYSLASMADASGRTYFHGDMLGTTRLISDDVAAPVVSPAFTAFGQPLPLAAAGGPVSPPNLGTRYGYAGSAGYQNDGAASAGRDFGVLHVGARYYDPAIGRFLQRDPIGIRGGINVYEYGLSAPTVRVDPNGLIAMMTFSSGLPARAQLAAALSSSSWASIVRMMDIIDDWARYTHLMDPATVARLGPLGMRFLEACRMVNNSPLN